MFVDSRAILSNFFEEQCTWKPPSIPFGIDACTFSEIAGKTTRDYTALALSSGWTRTQTIFSVNITKVEPYSHRLGGRYDTKPLYKVKFFCKKKLHYWVPLYFGTDEYYFTICKICEYLSIQRCRINSTLISHGFFVVMQIKDSVMFMAVVTFSSTVKTVKWVEATV